MQGLLERMRPYAAQLIAERRMLHAHPELSGQETRTMEMIAAALRELGLRVQVIPQGGVIGVLDGREDGACVLLRADCDALPIQESPSNLSQPRTCVSQNPGVMHACGHDAHMAMLLCAARTLAAMRDELAGRVLFVFEQGEERGGQGCLEHLLPAIDAQFRVDACYATHVRWDIPAGKLAVRPGAVMAGAFGFDVTIHGRGGHGSRPDLAASPIDCFCALHQQLSALRMRAAAPDQVLTYSLGLVQSGEQRNVIPDDLRFAGTVRTFDTAHAGERFADEMRRIIGHTCAAHGCGYTLTHFSRPMYEAANHPAAAALACEAIAGALGGDALTEGTPWMASETMGAYLRLWPGVLTFTGIANAQKGCGANHHTPAFDLDEDALLPGAAAACAYALETLRRRPKYDFQREIVSMDDLVSRSI